MTLGSNPATIIGVLPREADFLDDGVIGVVPISVELPWAPSSRGTNNLDAIGRLKAAGGDAQMLDPKDRGFRGNSHMIMQDKNNLQIADLILQWIDEHVGKRSRGKK